MRIVDTRGQKCPAPLIATKRALKEINTGDTIRVITDNRTSLSNISRFLKDNSIEFAAEEADNTWTLTITKRSTVLKNEKTEEYCDVDVPHFNKGDFVIAFNSDKMGTGGEDLGDLLMVNFIKAVRDLDHLPSKMVFYNRGVLLGSDDSPVVDHLKEIEKMGVSLLLCATCVNYYSLEEKVHIGVLSNMYEIAQAMASASNVIKP